jgi:hypothetical protein
MNSAMAARSNHSSYHFIDDTHVKFKVLHNTSDFDNPDYQFIDEKIEEDSF